MDRKNKITFWGTVDRSVVELEGAANLYRDLWDFGEYRMREADISRMEKYIDRLNKINSLMDETIKLFKPITKYESQYKMPQIKA